LQAEAAGDSGDDSMLVLSLITYNNLLLLGVALAVVLG
jgi:hypothetical protein